MTREWYSARELAGLPGMPGTERGAQKLAIREHWLSRDRAGRGGGREYHRSCLPAETRRALDRRELAGAAQDAGELTPAAARSADEQRAARLRAKEAGMAQFVRLPEHKRARARARFEVLQACWRFLGEHLGLRRREGMDLFAAEYRAGRIEVSAETRRLVPSADRATLLRWEKAERELGLHGLTDGYGKSKGRTKVAARPELERTILGLMVSAPAITGKRVMEYLAATKPELAATISERSVQRWMSTWKSEHASIWCHHTNPDLWKSKFKAAFGDASEGVVRLNQLWEMDSTPADVMLADGRHSILGVIDVYSRRLKLLVSKTSKTTMVATLFRRALLDWGVPEACRTDNGKDYVAAHFSALLRDLEVDHPVCIPFASEQKPFIERSFRTFSHQLLELVPGFIGHSVAERKAIESRKSFAERIMTPGEVVPVSMSAEELQRFCDDWCNSVYHHAAHDGLAGRTPFEMVAAWSQPVRRVEDERALDILLAEASQGGGRTVGKSGISVEGAEFVHTDLAPHIGARVRVKMDPDDLGRIFVFDAGGEQFICIAECPERLGISRAEVAAKARERQQEATRQAAKALREAKKAITTDDIASAIMDAKIRDAAKVVQLQAPQAEVHTTPALEAAADAYAATQPVPVVPVDPAVLERGDAAIVRMEEKKRERDRWAQEDAAAIQRFQTLATKNSESLSETDRAWVQAMAATDPKIRTWIMFDAPHLAPLLGRGVVRLG